MHGSNLKNNLGMAKMLKNSKAVGTTVLVTAIIIVIAICVTAGFIAYQYKPTAPYTYPYTYLFANSYSNGFSLSNTTTNR